MTRIRKLRVKNRRKRALILRVLGLIALVMALTITLPFFGILVACAKDFPRLESLTSPQSAQTSRVYASDETLITTFHAEQHRIVIPLSDIPSKMQQAVVTVEDERFYQHGGVDLEAIARAIVVNLRSGRVVEGGSTITQQYVRNAFIAPERTLQRKIKEAVLAYQVEGRHSKKEILEKYLNTIYFGHGCYGIEATAETFFGKKSKQLSLPECALLAGVIKSPSHYSPYTHPERAKSRRDLVLKMMADQGYITQKEANEAIAAPIEVQEIKKEEIPAAYFVEYVKQTLIDKYGANVVFKGGLRICTTLDPKMQQYAEEAPKAVLGREDDPSAAIVAIDPKTGYIKAMVGGKDFKTEKFNLAVQGKRQAGSSFKTFVLVAAVEAGVSPSKMYESGPVTFQIPGSKPWHVENYVEGSGGPPMTLREGTIRSVNCVYARLIMEVGAKNVVTVAKKMGITSQLDPYPAIALGGLRVGVSPLEMASAYGTLANMGVHCKPLAILKVTDAEGKILEKNKVEEKTVLKPGTAYLVTDILQDVIRAGTGRRANIGRPVAGKTGTAQNYQDAWFAGYTPDLSCAVWVGYPKGQIPMRNVHGIRVSGGSFPAQIWARFMSKALEDTPPSKFAVPQKDLVRVMICADTGLLASPYCPNVTAGLFVKGTQPTKHCGAHQGVAVPNVVGMEAEEARMALENLSLVVNQTNLVKASVPMGQVFDQNPAQGTVVPPGSMVDITVSSEPPPVPPVAYFTYTKSVLTVNLDASGSYDPEGGPLIYSWDLDASDGIQQNATGVTISHTYTPLGGTYTITLTVTNSKGAKSRTSQKIAVP
ncbi:MAG: PBP1A family penicillin-binding protein [Actinomycetota bacterium]|nr:PBP1A family penicillin-binding protein [Actinomycetota bacterium]